MTPEDYEKYLENGECSSKSQMKNLINLYSQLAKKIKNQNSHEFDGVKINIKKCYNNEIFFTMTDTQDFPVKFNLKEGLKEYVIPIFTDIKQYEEGSLKISKLFLEKLTKKAVTKKDIDKISSNDQYFMGVVINPHSQNFMMDSEGNI